MAEEGSKLARTSLRSTYVSTLMSISLVLFLIGVLGILLLYGKKISEYVKENVTLSIVIKEEAKQEEIDKLMQMLEHSEKIREATFVSRDSAAAEMKTELGEDFVDFLGYNPLLHSIEVHFSAHYADNESIAELEQSLNAVPIVKEVYYQKSLVDVVNRNLKTITLIIIGFSIMLCIISIVLVNTTIQLSIFARRLLIKSMQLVGATRNFIRKPFLIKGILNGLAGGLIAGALLAGMFYFAHRELPNLFPLEDMKMIAVVIGSVVTIGILISGISTWLSLNRYLSRHRDELY